MRREREARDLSVDDMGMSFELDSVMNDESGGNLREERRCGLP